MRSPVSTRTLLLGLGLLAMMVAAFSALDATRRKPTDGAVWHLQGKQIRVVGVTPGGPADRARIRVGDIIEGIDHDAIRSPSHAAQLLQRRSVGETVTYLVRRGATMIDPAPQLVLGSTRIADLEVYLVYCGLGAIFFLAGLWVFWHNPTQVPARIFFVLCSIFLVYFFAASERSAFYYWSDAFIRNVGTLASLLVPPVFLHFFLVFPRYRDGVLRRRWVLPALYALPLLYYVDFTRTQFFGTSMASVGALQQVTLGFYFTAGLASLVTTYMTSPDPKLRQRVKILTLGTVLGTLPFLVFNIALGKLLGRQDFALLGAVPMLLVPMSFGYTIARYRVMEIEVIIRRSLVFGSLTGLTVGVYLVLVVVVGNTVLNLTGQPSQLVSIIATLIIAAAFEPARERIQSFLERQFFREKHDLREALHNLSKEIPNTIERETLVEKVGAHVTPLLHPSRFAFLEVQDGVARLPEEDGHMPLPILSGLLLAKSAPLTPLGLQHEANRRSRSQDPDALAEREEFRQEVEGLRRAGLEVLVPALAGPRLMGLIALGPKRSEAAYEGAELEVLQIVGGQMAVQLENTRLLDEALARRRLEEELALARNIQQRLLPRSVPELRGLEVAAVNQASAQVSGDYYDFVTLSNGHTGLVISDVSGKGMPASLLASNLQASIRALAGTHCNPGDILTAVNRTLYESTDPDKFATLFLACVSPDGRTIQYSNGGHNPPLLRRADGTEVWLDTGGTPLGAFPGIEYPESTVQLETGDVLVLFTDGLTEAEDPAEEFFGEEGLARVLHQVAENPAGEIVQALRTAVVSHCDGGPAADDMTLIVLRSLPDNHLADPAPGGSAATRSEGAA